MALQLYDENIFAFPPVNPNLIEPLTVTIDLVLKTLMPQSLITQRRSISWASLCVLFRSVMNWREFVLNVDLRWYKYVNPKYLFTVRIMKYKLNRGRNVNQTSRFACFYVGNMHMNGTGHFSAFLSTNKQTNISSGCGFHLFCLNGRLILH